MNPAQLEALACSVELGGLEASQTLLANYQALPCRRVP
jgi:hypothetical protein